MVTQDSVITSYCDLAVLCDHCTGAVACDQAVVTQDSVITSYCACAHVQVVLCDCSTVDVLYTVIHKKKRCSTFVIITLENLDGLVIFTYLEMGMNALCK